MRLTEQHVSEARLNEIIQSYSFTLAKANSRQYGLRTAQDILSLLLECKQRRAEDRHRDAKNG